MKMNGIYLPIITPFLNNKIDFSSYKKLINHYIELGIHGIIPNGTTGESVTLEENETYELLEKTLEFVNGRIPVYFGFSSNFTDNLIRKMEKLKKYNLSGVLSACPYYNCPNQKGLYEHFLKLSESTDMDIIIYNIPYRTGTNLENNTLRKLAEKENIIGIKDSSGNIKQSLSLLMDPPDNFSILTGEDILFYITCVNGGDGGILASAHINTEKYIEIFKSVQDNNTTNGLKEWKEIYKIIPLLFQEPNPAPLKYILEKYNLIESNEVRLPLTNISSFLENKINEILFK